MDLQQASCLMFVLRPAVALQHTSTHAWHLALSYVLCVVLLLAPPLQLVTSHVQVDGQRLGNNVGLYNYQYNCEACWRCKVLFTIAMIVIGRCDQNIDNQ